MPLKLTDNDDEMLALLQQIARNTGGLDAPDQNITINEGDVSTTTTTNIDATDPNDEGNQPRNWFSTGPDPVALPTSDDTFTRVDFGFRARSIMVRFDGPVELAPLNPNRSQPATGLPAPSGDWGTFEIGGNPPINTGFLWIRAADDASEDVLVYLEAY